MNTSKWKSQKTLRQQQTTAGGAKIKFVIQNVRGFVKERRYDWMKAWVKDHCTAGVVGVMIQETHVVSQDEVTTLTKMWERVNNYREDNVRLSYWSIGQDKTSGVGVLFFPRFVRKISVWNEHLWNTRMIAFRYGEWSILNIYGPAQTPASRASFYQNLRVWFGQRRDYIILCGDFNCVEDPVLDRSGMSIRVKTECGELTELLNESRLRDSQLVHYSVSGEEKETEQIPFTFWRGGSASRLDRFYVSEDQFKKIHWTQVQHPTIPSDHEEVMLILYSEERRSRKPRRHSKIIYPIKGTGRESAQDEIRQFVHHQEAVGNGYVETWDDIVGQWKFAIQKVTSRRANRRRRKAHRLKMLLFDNMTTRQQCIEVEYDELKRQNQWRKGRRFHRSPATVRWLFRRTAIWESNQTVTNIIVPGTSQIAARMSVADKFAKSWATILGVSHRTTLDTELRDELDRFAPRNHFPTVTEEENTFLMGQISESEVLSAVKSLERRKAAGEDGLNNDFYKDFVLDMMEALLRTFNDIMEGGKLPPSFFKAVIIPLRKKGDSTNAMDYRPISLLQTGYKIFTKILARRLQTFLARLIGESQQGFVHGRRMDRSVMIMMAILEHGKAQPREAAADSGCVLLLDFAKAYDTVDRVYLQSVLQRFGFAETFVQLMEKLHYGTTAQFLVNGELSKEMSVKSGIRQGCPLAPLLFILAVEPLGIALHKEKSLEGITIRDRNRPYQHLFSAFVDDSTIFLQRASQVKIALRLVKTFGELSGLQVQPTKCVQIFLNTTEQRTSWQGIPVLQEEGTTRYLGYEIGERNLSERNWAHRIKAIQRRLIVAAQCGTSVMERVQLFNAIALPAILFTAKVFSPNKEVRQKLLMLQKHFVWNPKGEGSRERHKISPTLVNTPRYAGGLGLISIPLAIHTQYVKEAACWLMEPASKYSAAWRIFGDFYQTTGETGFLSPETRQFNAHTLSRGRGWDLTLRTLSQYLGPEPEQDEKVRRYVKQNVTKALTRIQNTEMFPTVAVRDGDRVDINICVDEVPWHDAIPEEIASFWGTYNWWNNPWIREANQGTIPWRKYDKIEKVTLKELRIRRTSWNTYRWTAQMKAEGGHTRAKVLRWLATIIWCSPRVCVGQCIGQEPTLQLLAHHGTLRNVVWRLHEQGVIHGRDSLSGEKWTYRQQQDGFEWRVEEINGAQGDRKAEIEEVQNLVFQANPLIHGYPWRMENRLRKQTWRHWLRQSFRELYNKYVSKPLPGVLLRWEKKNDREDWGRVAQEQSTNDLWFHGHMLTDYQIWVVYRAATHQLNVYYPGYEADNACRLDKECKAEGKGVTHIVWGCKRAMSFWARLISYWQGWAVSLETVRTFQYMIASRRAPPISTRFKLRVENRCDEQAKECLDQVQRLWWAIYSIGTAWIWRVRNLVIFQQQEWNQFKYTEFIWAKTMGQIRAATAYEQRRSDLRIKGMQLQICLECLLEVDGNLNPRQTAMSYKEEQRTAKVHDRISQEMKSFIVANST